MTDENAEVEARMFALWREMADKDVEHGIDWPGVARRLFRALDESAAREAAARAEGAQAVVEAVEERLRYMQTLDSYEDDLGLLTAARIARSGVES